MSPNVQTSRSEGEHRQSLERNEDFDPPTGPESQDQRFEASALDVRADADRLALRLSLAAVAAQRLSGGSGLRSTNRDGRG